MTDVGRSMSQKELLPRTGLMENNGSTTILMGKWHHSLNLKTKMNASMPCLPSGRIECKNT